MYLYSLQYRKEYTKKIFAYFFQIFLSFMLDAGLLDIGKDMAEATGHEKVFYLDQQNSRVCRLSEEIDESCQQMQQVAYDTAEKLNQQHEEENNYIMMDDNREAYLEDDTFTDFRNASSISLNRSGHARVPQTYIDTAIQTDNVQIDRPKLRIKKKGFYKPNQVNMCTIVISVWDIS